MGKGVRLIAKLRGTLDPELEIVDHEAVPSYSSGNYSLIWHSTFGELTLAQYVKAQEVEKALGDILKWKYVAQSVAIAKSKWQSEQGVLPIGAYILWKYACSNTFQYRDTKTATLWKREERIGNDWRYLGSLELNDFRGATSCDRKYFLPSGEEILRNDWNHNAEWFAAIRRWEFNN
jgi:hypothetical protein